MATSQNVQCNSGNVEGSLANKLHSAVDVTCEKFISSLKFSRMKNAYRPIYDKHPEFLRNIHTQLMSQMKKTISEGLEQVTKEYSTSALLDSLETIKKDQEPFQPSWRPSGNPEEDLRDHIYPLKVEHKESLQTMLYKLQLENEALINTVEVNHGEIIHLKQSNEDLQEQFSGIVNSFTFNEDHLKRNMEAILEEK